MATESPMRILEDSRTEKWVSAKDTVSFASPMNEVAADELGLLLKGHKIHGHNRNKVPNRSGSAPPSMEGSFSAYGNLVYDQCSSRKLSFASLDTAMQNWQSEEQMRADPSYFAYYNSNVNLNPRLPPPIISRENRHLTHHFADLGDSCHLNSSDNSKDGSLHVTRSSLSTHDEEPEDEYLPQSGSDDLPQSGASGQHLASFAGQHKSLVDLIQEDFPRTPSPVYNQSRSSGHVAAEEPTVSDIQSLTLDGLSLDISNKHNADPCADVSGDHGITASDLPLVITLEKESCVDNLGRSHSPQKGELPCNDAHLMNELLVSDEIASGISKNVQATETSKNKDERYSHSRNAVEQHQQQYHSQRSMTCQVNGPQVQANTLGTNTLQSNLAKGYGHNWFTSVEVQAAPQGSGLTPPLYATAAAYMASGNPYYSNLSQSGGYAPQYNIGGYALGSPSLSPFLAGYPSMHNDAGSGRSFNGQSVAPRENVPQIGDMHHLTKFYGHHGLMMHPSFPDPFHMQYFHHPHPVDDSHASPSQYMRFPSPGVFGLEVDAYASQKEPNIPSYIAEQNFLRPPIGSLNLPSAGKMIIPGNNYFGSPSGLGFTQQFPASPLGSPILSGSPMGRRNEIKPAPGSGRNNGLYSGWPAQRSSGSLNDSKRHSFLEELKQSNARRVDLSDIAGRVVEFSVDQHGSRFIQQKLENCSVEEKASVFKEILPHASKLITDVFGNYVIQKFFEHGSHEQRKMLACQLAGQMLPLSLQMYGCRVIQKALEVIDLDQKTELVHELNGHVMRCVRDQNGNHVIQKCIECMPTEKISFIISSFQGQVAILSTHPYGCRVIQRVLEHCSENSQSRCIVHEILDSAYALAQDQYGNYVTQHVLERGRPHERSQIIGKLTGNIVQLSQHKYASNVVEKCLEYGDSAERELLIEEILAESEGNDCLLTMMKDQFANYVVQKILEISNNKHREILLSRIRVHLHALKKYTYGKHIVARFEQLSDEDISSCEL